MKGKESNVSSGFGTGYKKSVSTRSDKIGGHGDMQMAATQAAFKKANQDSKKA